MPLSSSPLLCVVLILSVVVSVLPTRIHRTEAQLQSFGFESEFDIVSQIDAMSQSQSVRPAAKAGSWYLSDKKQLTTQIDGWLDAASKANAAQDDAVLPSDSSLRALIGPHAGLSYSGRTAAYAYTALLDEINRRASIAGAVPIRRIFLLGPSHRHYTAACELSAFDAYATPLLQLSIDTDTIASLQSDAPQLFGSMKRRTDEEEHSIELHLPFVARVFQKLQSTQPSAIQLVPLLVGSLSTSTEQQTAQALLPHWRNEENFFIVSSDFCHWGDRFDFAPYDETAADGSKQAIWQSIQAMDRQGMQACESLQPKQFASYLDRTQNTICGRHPIGVLLNLIDLDNKQSSANAASDSAYRLRFIHYEQSSQVTEPDDSSVSYASALITKRSV